MTYDENLSCVLESIGNSECAYVSVRGHRFYAFEEDNCELLTRFAHHSETRYDIEELRHMLDEVLKNSMPSKAGSGGMTPELKELFRVLKVHPDVQRVTLHTKDGEQYEVQPGEAYQYVDVEDACGFELVLLP